MHCCGNPFHDVPLMLAWLLGGGAGLGPIILWLRYKLRKKKQDPLVVVAQTEAGSVTATITDPEQRKAILEGKHSGVSMGCSHKHHVIR